MILAIRKKIQTILANRDVQRARLNNDIFEAASAADAQDVIEAYELEVVEAVLKDITPELVADTEYAILLAARNIIFGYTDKELDISSLIKTIEDISNELKRLSRFGISNIKSSLPEKRTVEEKIFASAHLPEPYQELLEEGITWISHIRNHYFQQVLKLSGTSSIEDFLIWCHENRYHLPNLQSRNYVRLLYHAASPDKEIWMGDADGHFIAKAKGKLDISIMPEVYEVYSGDLKKVKPIIIDLYEDKEIYEK